MSVKYEGAASSFFFGTLVILSYSCGILKTLADFQVLSGFTPHGCFDDYILFYYKCLQGYRLVPIEFEKDDELNYHAEFVAAASSLRGRNYGIPSADKLQVLILSFVKFLSNYLHVSSALRTRVTNIVGVRALS